MSVPHNNAIVAGIAGFTALAAVAFPLASKPAGAEPANAAPVVQIMPSNFPKDGKFLSKDEALRMTGNAMLLLYNDALPSYDKGLYKSIAEIIRKHTGMAVFAYSSDIPLGRMQIAAKGKIIEDLSSDKLAEAGRGTPFLFNYVPKLYNDHYGKKHASADLQRY